MCCYFWEKCINSRKSGLGCRTPLSNWNSDFQENVLQEYYKNGGDSWFDTFMPKTLHFLGRPPFE